MPLASSMQMSSVVRGNLFLGGEEGKISIEDDLHSKLRF